MKLVWTAWLVAIAASFALFEGYALRSKQSTLSQFIYDTTLAWPPLPFVIGIMVGGLAVHFWWHWTPT